MSDKIETVRSKLKREILSELRGDIFQHLRSVIVRMEAGEVVMGAIREGFTRLENEVLCLRAQAVLGKSIQELEKEIKDNLKARQDREEWVLDD